MAVVSVLAELQRDHLARTATEAPAPADGLSAAPEPTAGQVYSDGHNPGYTWRVQWADAELIFLRLRGPDGEATAGYRNWPRGRWQAFVAMQLLELVSGGD